MIKWTNSLISNPDLGKFKNQYHSMELLARIYNNELNVKLKISDIIDDYELLNSWQNTCPTIRKAKQVLENGHDAPNNLRKVGTLLNNQECKLFKGCLVRYDRNLIDQKQEKILHISSKHVRNLDIKLWLIRYGLSY